MARPGFEVTDKKRQYARTLAAMGLPHDDIATLVGASPKTLRKYFAAELQHSPLEANAKVMETLYTMATSGANTSASIFWAKSRCGMKDVVVKNKPQAEEPPNLIVKLA